MNAALGNLNRILKSDQVVLAGRNKELWFISKPPVNIPYVATRLQGVDACSESADLASVVSLRMTDSENLSRDYTALTIILLNALNTN